MNRPLPPAATIPTLVIACLLALSAGGCASTRPAPADRGPYRYELRLPEGDTFRQLMRTESTSTMTGPTGPQETSQELEAVLRYDVVHAPAGEPVVLRLTYESIRATGTNQLGPFDYDSALGDEPDNVAERVFAAMLGHSLELTLARTGETLRVDGGAELQERILDALDLPAAARTGPAADILDRFAGSSPMDQIFSMMTRIFPDRPVSVGESWAQTTSLDGIAPLVAANSWTLIDRAGGVATLSLSGEVGPGEDPTMSMGGLSMRYDLSGTQSGEMTVDESIGWPRSLRVVSDYAGSIRMEGGPSTVPTMSMEVSAHTVHTMETAR